MLFNSNEFLIFFPIVVVGYFVVPKKIKQIWLLLASYYFYMSWNVKYFFLLLGITVLTYISGVVIESARLNDKDVTKRAFNWQRFALWGSIFLTLGLLFYFKYVNFGLDILSKCFSVMGLSISIPHYDILLPVGISFYTFQAIGYVIDVYRGEVYAEKNFFKYALFVSFFPQLVAGPIERSKNLLKQLSNSNRFSFDNFREGLLLMLWGFFLKIVVADRIAIFVDAVYTNYELYSGCYIIVATILFAFQIYCDFAGYSTIAMGAAKILGYELMDNFRAPYLSTSVSDFWRNWHISLTSWFTDYLYIPLGGNRRGKLRTQINKMIVFFVSGLWHGADITFVLWGGINGFYQVLGDVLSPVREKFIKLFRLNRESVGHKLINGLITFFLVDISWLFFRAQDFSHAKNLIKSIIRVNNPWILFDGSLFSCGIDEKNFHVIVISIMIILISDWFKKRGIRIRNKLMEQDYWFREVVIALFIVIILTFGVWGPEYNEANFIYFQF